MVTCKFFESVVRRTKDFRSDSRVISGLIQDLPVIEDFAPRQPQPRGGRGASFTSVLRRGWARTDSGIGEELVRMRAFDALSVVRSAVRGEARDALPRIRAVRTGARSDAKVMPVAYNPGGGIRVQQAWQRYSTSPRYRRGAPPFVHPAVPACPVRPAACR
ncbi:hypothetical protein GCM10027075_26180 [Streptomyces heilongjiangensis]